MANSFVRSRCEISSTVLVKDTEAGSKTHHKLLQSISCTAAGERYIRFDTQIAGNDVAFIDAPMRLCYACRIASRIFAE
jgi:hypothetical protein